MSTWGKNEIQFIQDEMAAIAEEYNLEMDQDVKEQIQQRKKTRKKRKISSTSSLSTITVSKTKNKKTGSSHLTSMSWKAILPKHYVFDHCSFPGCSCKIKKKGHRVKKQLEFKPSESTLREVNCSGCDHSILHHTFTKLSPDEITFAMNTDEAQLRSSTSNTHNYGELFMLIRAARISASIYKTKPWLDSTLKSLNELMQLFKAKSRSTSDANHGSCFSNMLAELSPLVQQVQNWKANCAREELPIYIAMGLDQMYFKVYYASILAFGRNHNHALCAVVDSPLEYFSSLEIHIPELNQLVEDFCNEEDIFSDHDEQYGTHYLSYGAKKWTSQSTKSHLSELHQLLLLRWRETIRLFYGNDIEMNGEMDKALNTLPAKSHLPCAPISHKWRDNCRDWFCHLYAYASPPALAMLKTQLKPYEPLVEMGAGTGYWSALLQQHEIQIQAFDTHPTSGDSVNAFHAKVPGFCHVTQGGAEELLKPTLAQKNLLLCYPPPNDPMARDCLRHFQGRFVLYIGEWMGDTADRQFEIDLEHKCTLVKRIPLPNWFNTCYELSIWKTKTSEIDIEQQEQENVVVPAMLSCSGCHKPSSSIRRCRMCRSRSYCSARCQVRDTPDHDREHRRRLMFLAQPQEFQNPKHFEHLLGANALVPVEDYQTRVRWQTLVPGTSTGEAPVKTTDAGFAGFQFDL